MFQLPKTLPVLAATTLVLTACRTFESPVADFNPAVLDELLGSPVVSDLGAEADYPWRYGDEVADADGQVAPQRDPAPRIAGDERVNLELRGVPLGEALHLIAERAKVNVVLDASMNVPVSASFPSVRLDDALQILLAQNGLALVEDPPGIFWIRRADGSAAKLTTFQLRSVNAADVADNLSNLLGEGATVVADANQNVILVNGTEADGELAAEYLRLADRLKPQVLLEVRIFEATLSDDFELGLSYRFDGSIDGNTLDVLSALSTSGTNFSTTFSTADGDVETTINALRDHVGLELVSAPRVMVITNTEAVVEVITEVPYVLTTSSIDTGASATSFAQVTFKEVGVKLTVTPTIQEAGVLQVVIDQELSEVISFFLDTPVVDTRHFATQFLVADRQTIVLGGLMQDSRRDTDNGIPLLMDLPGIGRLFRRDEDSMERRELLVFITPRILDPNQAARMAKNFQADYRERRRGIAAELNQPDPEPGLGGDQE
jgi:type II secretory pathway component GspD/PulD (secretin)